MKNRSVKGASACACRARTSTTNQRRNYSILRRLLLVVLLACLLGCQQTSTVEKQQGQTANPAAQPSKIALAGLTGLVIAESDVSGRPDNPLPNQMVLAIPVEKVEAILGPGTQQLEDERLRFLKTDLPRPDPAITVTLTDAAGNYTLLLIPGQYFVCLADSEKTPPSFPATTRGCGRALVRPAELRRVDVSSGFGEILLVEQ